MYVLEALTQSTEGQYLQAIYSKPVSFYLYTVMFLGIREGQYSHSIYPTPISFRLRTENSPYRGRLILTICIFQLY